MTNSFGLYEEICTLFTKLSTENHQIKTGESSSKEESSTKDQISKKAIVNGFEALLFKDPPSAFADEEEVDKFLTLVQYFEKNQILEKFIPVLVLLFNVKPLKTNVHGPSNTTSLFQLANQSFKEKPTLNPASQCQRYKFFNTFLFQKPFSSLNQDESKILKLQSEFNSTKHINKLDTAHKGLFGALTNPPMNLDGYGIYSNSRFILALDKPDNPPSNFKRLYEESNNDDPESKSPSTSTLAVDVHKDPWENLENLIGMPTLNSNCTDESPFLCHAPLENMEFLCYKHEENLKIFANKQLRSLCILTEQQFRKSIELVLRGIESNVFVYRDDNFCLNYYPIVNGLTPDLIAGVLSSVLECGRLVRNLNSVSWLPNHGFVRNSLAVEIQTFLKSHDELVELVMQSSSLISNLHGTKVILPSLRLVHDLWFWQGWENQHGSGIRFLQHLVNCASSCTDPVEQDFYSGYFLSCVLPFLKFLSNWIYRGQCFDPFNEFLISVKSEFLERRDRSYWTDGFCLDKIDYKKEPGMGYGVENDAIYGLLADVHLCGKTVNLLKLCNGENEFRQGPPLRIGMNLEELRHIRSECSRYADEILPELVFVEPPKKLEDIAQRVREEKLAQLIQQKQNEFKKKAAAKHARNVAAQAELNEQLRLKHAEQKALEQEDRLLEEDIKLYHEMIRKREASEKEKLILKYAQLLDNQSNNQPISLKELNGNDIQTDSENNILRMDAQNVQTSSISPPKSALTRSTDETFESHQTGSQECLNTKDTSAENAVISSLNSLNSRERRHKQLNELTRDNIKAKILSEEFGLRHGVSSVTKDDELDAYVPPEIQLPREWNVPDAPSYTKVFKFDARVTDDDNQPKDDWIKNCRPESKEIFNLSLSFFVQRSLLFPIRTQCKIVNRALLSLLIGSEHQLMRHLDTLRQFLFLDNGPFSYCLAKNIGLRLGQLTHVNQLINVPSMSFILQTALNTVHADDHYASRLSFYIKEAPTQATKSHFEILDCFTLRYRVEWPLNLILTEEIMDSYSQIFSFVLQIRLAAWAMQDTFVNMTKLDPQVWYLIHKVRHSIDYFVNTIQNYVMSQLLNLAWNDFINELRTNAHSLDDLYRIHENYVYRAKARLLLSTKSASLIKIVRDALGLSLKFRGHLLATNYCHTSQLQTQATFIYNKIQEYTKFISLVLEKASDRTQQTHLKELHLKLNYNEFFSA